MELDKAGHVIYDNINNIKWNHMPKPMAKEIDEVLRYYYLEDRLYLFRYTELGDTHHTYFMAKGNSPWDALRNHFAWDDVTYADRRNLEYADQPTLRSAT